MVKTLPLVLAKLVIAEVVLDAALDVVDDDAFEVVTVDKVDEALVDVVSVVDAVPGMH